MNIDDLTIGEARKLAAMFPQGTPTPAALTGSCSNRPERAVLVTTAHRGVFFGYATDTDGDVINLRAARNAIYWPVGNKGFLGLAADGPISGSRIGPPADIQLRAITCVAEVTAEATKKWEQAPWSK